MGGPGFSKWLGCFEIELVIPIDYCTGVGAATSGIANPLTWVQIPACALLIKTLRMSLLTRSLDIKEQIGLFYPN